MYHIMYEISTIVFKRIKLCQNTMCQELGHGHPGAKGQGVSLLGPRGSSGRPTGSQGGLPLIHKALMPVCM